MEELKKLNQPPKMQVSPLPCPTPEQWNGLLNILAAQYRLLEEQKDTLDRMLYTAGTLSKQAEKLTKEMAWTREIIQQAGSKKEQRPLLRMPKIPLPQPSLMWLWAIPVLVALRVMWYASGTILNGLSQMAQLLP